MCNNTTEYVKYEQQMREDEQKKIEYKTTKHTVLKSYPSPLGNNCVAYAKSQGSVPMGVATLGQKLAKIKSHDPAEGKIGVTAEGKVGHLVVVEKVKENTVVISEGNYRHGFITWREIPKSLVMGYL